MTDLICIVCPRGCALKTDGKTVQGNACPRGAAYALEEVTSPKRMVTDTVEIEGALYRRLPVQTNKAVAKGLVVPICQQLHHIKVTSPIGQGDVIVENILNSGADIIAGRNM
jgi:CxxC motif-containing protein